MKYSGIGGQAVMEGVMMRAADKYAVAVRLPNGEINIDKYDAKPRDRWYHKVPLIRGVVSFVDSLVIGMSTLMESSKYFDDEEEFEKKSKMTEDEAKQTAHKENAELTATFLFSIVLAIGIFVLIPYYASVLLERFITNDIVVSIFEGVLRLVIFIAYIKIISHMEDIHRVFMYHGAEHKCINCIENGLELNVENVRASSKEHKRCGTSFILFVMLISILVFIFVRFDTRWLQLVVRFVMIPVIAGVAYEILRWAGNSNSKLVNIVSKPGLWLQGLTTAEPTDDIIEVGIASVEAVFDWKKFQEENM